MLSGTREGSETYQVSLTLGQSTTRLQLVFSYQCNKFCYAGLCHLISLSFSNTDLCECVPVVVNILNTPDSIPLCVDNLFDFQRICNGTTAPPCDCVVAECQVLPTTNDTIASVHWLINFLHNRGRFTKTCLRMSL